MPRDMMVVTIILPQSITEVDPDVLLYDCRSLMVCTD